MCSPPGDQAGVMSAVGASVRGRAPPPAKTGAIQSDSSPCDARPREEANTIHRPSGDQAGVMSIDPSTGSSVSGRIVAPLSSRSTSRLPCPLRSAATIRGAPGSRKRSSAVFFASPARPRPVTSRGPTGVQPAAHATSAAHAANAERARPLRPAGPTGRS
jgi:hypothetical protein